MTIPGSQVEQVRNFARMAHEGQTRDGGTPYFEDHVEQVEKIVIDHFNCVSSAPENHEFDLFLLRCLALLHDVNEDCDDLMDSYNGDFNSALRDHVDFSDKGVYYLLSIFVDHLTTSGPRVSGMYKNMESKTSKMNYLMYNRSPYVVVVKLADRLHNISSMGSEWSSARQERYIEQTLQMLGSLSIRNSGWDNLDIYLCSCSLVTAITNKIEEIKNAQS